MGIWITSGSIGNVLGQQIAGLYYGPLGLNWEDCLMTCAFLMILSALLFALFITQEPKESLLVRDERGQG
jgi:MFS family permease